MAIPLSAYVHVPWCVRKCPYCDFNSHERRGEPPFDAYLDALKRDLSEDLSHTGGRSVSSVFFGGGTPSLFPPQHVAAVLEAIAAGPGLEADAEVTLEANPGTVEHEPLAAFRAAGVNRLSLGVQSFHDESLRRIGRIHSADEAARVAGSARELFDRLNLDLMYGLPGQDLAMADRDLERAVELGPDHISRYELTLEPGTVFAARPPERPDEDQRWEMERSGESLLAAAGLERYEVSAWALPGCRSRHNLNYWSFGDYLGLGAGAHGKLTDPAGPVLRTQRERQPRRYIDDPGTQRLPVPEGDLPFEFMLNALRLVDGVPADCFESRTRLSLSTIRARLDRLVEAGLIEDDRARIAPTREGLRLLNDLQAAFLPSAA